MPEGALDERARGEIKAFYGDVFDFDALEVPLFGKTGLLLRTDDETSQFLLLMEQDVHIQSPGYDHLGLLLEHRVNRADAEDDHVILISDGGKLIRTIGLARAEVKSAS